MEDKVKKEDMLRKKRKEYVQQTEKNIRRIVLRRIKKLPIPGKYSKADVTMWNSLLVDLEKNTCTLCKGKYHTESACGNIFYMDKQMSVVQGESQQIWWAYKYSFVKEADKLYKKERFSKTGCPSKTFVKLEKESISIVTKLFAENANSYTCLFCEGKGHPWPECGVKWLLNKRCKYQTGLSSIWAEKKAEINLKWNKVALEEKYKFISNEDYYLKEAVEAILSFKN
jgi:hypothetical protein